MQPLTTKPKPFCFVLMPFNSEFNDIYKLGIQQSCIDAGAYCERVDEQIYTESMLERIYNQISKADIIIADMTGRNPNVFYEVGYAHALGKKTVLLTQKSEDIPFDLKHYPHIVYEGKILKIQEELTRRVKWLIKNAGNETVIAQRDFELFFDSKSLAKKKVVFAVTSSNDYIKFTVYNNSLQSYMAGDFKIGIVTEKGNNLVSDASYRRILLPDGRTMHMLPNYDRMFYPYEYFDFFIGLSPEIFTTSSDREPTRKFIEEGIKLLIIRVFTRSGTTDFKFYLELDDTNLDNDAARD